jgi:hypothetical protein
LPWDGHCRLKQRNRSDIGYGEFVGLAVTIGVSGDLETLLGLHPMVVVHGSVGELPDGNNRPCLVIRQDD